MTAKSISVVIPVYNGKKTIAETITAAINQSYQNKPEIIVVDDGSTDGTADVIRSHKGVTCIYQKNAGPAAARNRGTQAATGEIVFFTDADCIPNPDWIEKSIVHFTDPQIAVVAGSYAIANPDIQLARCIHDEIIYRHGHLMPEFPKSFGSYNFCARKKVLEDVGGFDTGYRFASGEDNDLSYKILRAGYRIFFTGESKVKHFHTVRVYKYMKEQLQHGFWRVKMYLDHPFMSLGDDYTFWKDIIEPPLALFFLCALLAGFFNPGFILPAIFTSLILVILQVYYSMRMIKKRADRPFFAFLTFCRAFVRALGFVYGLFYFSVQKIFSARKH